MWITHVTPAFGIMRGLPPFKTSLGYVARFSQRTKPTTTQRVAVPLCFPGVPCGRDSQPFRADCCRTEAGLNDKVATNLSIKQALFCQEITFTSPLLHPLSQGKHYTAHLINGKKSRKHVRDPLKSSKLSLS